MRKLTIVFFIFFIFISIQLYTQTWSSTKRLTWTAGASEVYSIAVDGSGGIHVAWQDYTPGNNDVFYKRSTNGGVSWLGSARLTWTASESEYPCIAADNNNRIYVAWNDNPWGNIEVFYKCSTDSGATWSGLNRLTWNTGHSLAPCMTTDAQNRLHVVWVDTTPGNYEIFYKRTASDGGSWYGLKRLTWNSDWSITPSIAADSNNGIHVVWQNEINGNREILYKRSTDSGTTWSPITRFTWNSGKSGYPCVVTYHTNNVYVVWADDSPGNSEIFYKCSTDGGVTWSAPIRMTWNSGYSDAPTIAVGTDLRIHVMWSDTTPGNKEIFYKWSYGIGSPWSQITRLTWNGGESKLPSIAVDNSLAIHVVWSDDYETTPDYYEIYYKNRK